VLLNYHIGLLFSVRFVLEILCGWVWVVSVLQASAAPNLQHKTNREQKTDVVIQQHSRKLLIMAILMSETCWVHKKWNKITRDIKLVFYSWTITMMHGLINPIWHLAVGVSVHFAIRITSNLTLRNTASDIYSFYSCSSPILGLFHWHIFVSGPVAR